MSLRAYCVSRFCSFFRLFNARVKSVKNDVSERRTVSLGPRSFSRLFNI